MSSQIGKRRKAARKEGAESYQKRRKEIAEAAAIVFNRVGFRSASMEAVANELGTDRATLYYYIGSKEELFDEITREVLEENVHMSQRLQRSRIPPRDKLEQLIIAMMVSYGKHYPLLYIYVRENLSHVPKERSTWAKGMIQLNHDFEKAVIAIIEEGYKDRTFQNVGDSKIVAYGIIGAMNWSNRWFRPDTSKVGAEEIGKTFARMILSGLDAD
ncbi:MAG: TetR/AcrR family transcriptional regulator [Steroidobacteraceae bacterium]